MTTNAHLLWVIKIHQITTFLQPFYNHFSQYVDVSAKFCCCLCRNDCPPGVATTDSK